MQAGQANLTAGQLSAWRDQTSVIKYVQASRQHARNLVHFKHLAYSTQHPLRFFVTAAVSFEICPASLLRPLALMYPTAAKDGGVTLENLIIFL